VPVTIKKLAGGGAQVSTPNMIHAKKTSMEKAMAQKRLLNAVDHGWKPTGKARKMRKMMDGGSGY